MSQASPVFRKVLSLSGGRTSAFLLHLMLQEMSVVERRDLIILFANTGKERNETLDFLREIEIHWKVKIVWVEYTRVPSKGLPCIYTNTKAKANFEEAQKTNELVDWFRVVDYKTAKRRFDKDTPFEQLIAKYNYLPNVQARYCSDFLKARTMSRYLLSIGVTHKDFFIGIRYDERDRTINLLAEQSAFLKYSFPLVEKKVGKRDVEDFWKNNDFDLQLKGYQGNCDFCFLKSRSKLTSLMREDSRGAEWWIQKEKEFVLKNKNGGNGKFWRIDLPYQEIQKISKRKTILDLLGTINGVSVKDEPACSCADGGFKMNDDF